MVDQRDLKLLFPTQSKQLGHFKDFWYQQKDLKLKVLLRVNRSEIVCSDAIHFNN